MSPTKKEIYDYIRQSREGLPPEKIYKDWNKRTEWLEAIEEELVRVIESENRESELRIQALCEYGGVVKCLRKYPNNDREAWIKKWAPEFPRTRECPEPETALRQVMALRTAEEVNKALRVQQRHYAEYKIMPEERVYRRAGDLSSFQGRGLEYSMLNPAPLGFHWWALTAALGAACQNRLYLAEGAQEIWPNWYVVLGGRKNCGKSAAMKIAMEILYKTNEKLILRSEANYDKYLYHKLIKILAEESTLKGLQLDLGRQMSEEERKANENKELGPIDATGILPLDEMASYFGKQSFQVTEKFPFFNNCKNAVLYLKGTGESKVELVNTALSMIACCAPAWLRGTIQADQLGAGFWDRCMVVYREPVQERAEMYPNWKLPPRDPVECSWLAQYLVNILDFPKKIPAFLSVDAKRFMDDVHLRLLSEEHKYEKVYGHVDEIISAGRMTNYILQLSMLITVGQHIDTPLEIPLADVEWATKIIDVEMRSLRSFMDAARLTGEDPDKKIFGYISLDMGGCARWDQIYKKFYNKAPFYKIGGVDAVRRSLENLMTDGSVQPCSFNTHSLREDCTGKTNTRWYKMAGHDEEACPTCKEKL